MTGPLITPKTHLTQLVAIRLDWLIVEVERYERVPSKDSNIAG